MDTQTRQVTRLKHKYKLERRIILRGRESWCCSAEPAARPLSGTLMRACAPPLLSLRALPSVSMASLQFRFMCPRTRKRLRPDGDR